MPPWAASIPYEAEGPVTSHLHSTSTTYVTSNGVAKETTPRVTDGPEGDDTLMPPIEQAPKKREREGRRVGGLVGHNAVSMKGGYKTTGVWRESHGLMVGKKILRI